MRHTFSVFVVVLTLLFASVCVAESYPEFSRDYWVDARKSAEGKKWRGVGLGILGVASVAPTAIFINKAVENPQKFLAYSVVSGIATLGMSLHGFLSIRTGIKERELADRFIAEYDDPQTEVSVDEEREAYMATAKTSTVKLMIFGGALILQSAALLANGIVLSTKKSRGDDVSDIKIWPSYLLGGLLLAGGSAILIGKTVKLRELNRLERTAFDATQKVITLEPMIQYDPATGETGLGMMGTLSF